MLALFDKMPYVAWDGKRPSLAHLRIFGCDSFVHIPKERRQNINSKLENCIFVGYKNGAKGYKLWNPTIGTAIYSKDVIFVEDEISSKTKQAIREKESEKIEFDLNNESHDSGKSTKSEEKVAQYKL